MVTVAYPLWLIFQNPKLNILIVTGPGLMEKFGIKIREYVIKYGPYFNVYLSDKKHMSTHIMFEDENKSLYTGSIRIASTGGSIVGQDADYVILDDPYSGKDEDLTPTAMQKKIEWANRVIEQRIEPHTKYCILHTRWNTNDLIGYYKRTQRDLFDFVEFPALTEDNQPLWKEKYTYEDLRQKRESMGERLFSSIYLQKPLDETSDFFDMEQVNYGPLPKDDKIIKKVRSWDIAGAESLKGDFTVGVPLYWTDKGNLLLKDFIRGKYSSETANVVHATAENDGKKMPILIETGVAASGYLLFKEWENRLEGYPVEQSKPINSKVDRATPLRNLVTDGKLYVDIVDSRLEDAFYYEFKSFPYGKNDDIVDAIAHGLNWFKHSETKKTKPGLVRIKR